MNPVGRHCTGCNCPLPENYDAELCPNCKATAAGQIGPEDPTSEAVSIPPSSEKPAWRLQDGQDFGGYRILRLLGEGGMGAVYQAWDYHAQRHVALKLLRGQSQSQAARERFLREGQLAATLNHPNTVYVFGTEEIEGRRVIVMEVVWGGTLSHAVRRLGPLPPADAVGFIQQVVDGLEAAANKGILHCDIKPSNCFLDANGIVKVGDFSLAVTSRTASTAVLTVLAEGGTPGYAAPEQIRGDPVDFRADVYSVGVTLYFLLTGELPFSGDNTDKILARALTEPAPSRRALRRRMPPPLANTVCRCLAQDPAKRFQSYPALREALLLFSTLWPRQRRYIELSVASLITTGILIALLVQAWLSWPQRTWAPLLWCLLALTPLVLFQLIFLRPGQTAFRVRCLNLRLSRALHGQGSLGRSGNQENPSVPLPAPSSSPPGRKVGPYEVVAWLGGGKSPQGTVLAFDPELRRQVWIRLRPTGAGLPFSNPTGRPTRLRLLSSDRADDNCWDAYQAVSGHSLVQTPLKVHPWRRVRGWLLWLTKELMAAAADGSLPHRLDPDQIWISDSGVPVLLDFGAQGSSAADERERLDPPTSAPTLQIFLKRVALVALEGNVAAAADAASRGPQVPLPSHARRFLEHLGRLQTIEEAARFLEEHMDWRAEVQWRGRLFASSFTGFLIGLAFLGTLANATEGTGLLIFMGSAFAAGLAVVVVTGSNFGMHLALLRVITHNGSRPQRWRHALRTTLVLAPFFALLVSLKCHALVLAALLGTLVVVGLLCMVVRPDRGLHDLLAGTWVVPDE